MVVREMPIHLTEQLLYFAAQSPKQLARKCTTHTIAAIDGNLHRPSNFDVTHNIVEVHRENIKRTSGSLATSKLLGLNAFTQFLNLFTINRSGSQDHLKTVVIGGIVTTGNHDAGFGCLAINRVIGGEVDHWRGNHAEVNHINTSREQAFC